MCPPQVQKIYMDFVGINFFFDVIIKKIHINYKICLNYQFFFIVCVNHNGDNMVDENHLCHLNCNFHYTYIVWTRLFLKTFII